MTGCVHSLKTRVAEWRFYRRPMVWRLGSQDNCSQNFLDLSASASTEAITYCNVTNCLSRHSVFKQVAASFFLLFARLPAVCVAHFQQFFMQCL